MEGQRLSTSLNILFLEEENMFKKVLSLSLISTLVISPMFVESLQAMSKAETSSKLVDNVKAKVKDLGVGADVAVWRKQSEPVKGRIEAIEEESFALKPKQGTAQHISCDAIVRIDPTRLSYRQTGQPDPVEVRRVVIGLGLGKKVKLTLADGQKLHCRLQAIGQDNFTIRDSMTETVSQLAYRDVTQLEPKGLSKDSKIAIIIGAGAAAGLLIGLLVFAHGG
jgi:hypothetical protein